MLFLCPLNRNEKKLAMQESEHSFENKLPEGKMLPLGNGAAMVGGDAVVVGNDAMLKQVVKEDPQKGFELIFRRYYQPLCSHAIRFVYSRQAAEDIVSEVFYQFWHKKLYEKVGGSYHSYLYVAVRNKAYNHARAAFGEQALKEEPDADDTVPEHANPETIFLYDELFSTIAETVNAFPPQCRRVFMLSRYEGKKNSEIASTLDIKIKTVEAHMMKALALLKKSVHDYFN